MAANADGSLFESRELGRMLMFSTDHSTRSACVSKLLALEDEEAHIYQSMKSFPTLRTIGSSLLKPLASRSCSTHSRSLFPEYLEGLSPCVILPRMCFFLKILVERSRY